MRSDQYMGLTARAKKIVGRSIRVREIGVTIMPDQSVVKFDRTLDKPLAEITVIGQIEGHYLEPGEHVANLHRYTFPSGVVYEEYVQCKPWHGGPCYFIALRRPSGKFLKTSLWSRKDTGMSEDVNNYGATKDESKRDDQ
ncbi:MAG: hypothetical protein JSS86_13185 [Cyanobacteria bacterium SZAS LIN-2]|nr:hypothetical protein [Cyanobacteria bacterium SZAS LIN-3]MBS1997265.1 hypothetical protein [Cyanobacteria bacterium SZAS LIN-2]MBS2010247.1 hypothetical protein [Cyanobacteria bacterium SZAS TMP-1]